MSVHKGHRICNHRGVLVCANCGVKSMCVNCKLRRDCVAGCGLSQENDKPRDPTARARVAPLCRRCAAKLDGCGGRGSGERMGPFPLWSDFPPVCGASVLALTSRGSRLFNVCWNSSVVYGRKIGNISLSTLLVVHVCYSGPSPRVKQFSIGINSYLCTSCAEGTDEFLCARESLSTMSWKTNSFGKEW